MCQVETELGAGEVKKDRAITSLKLSQCRKSPRYIDNVINAPKAWGGEA